MDVNYTNAKKVDDGVLKQFEIDFDTVDKKDFVITVGIDNHVLTGGSLWYIENTEYGGIVDDVEVITSSNTIQYSGRNFRALLSSKILLPPLGIDYKTVNGNIATITNHLLKECGLDQFFVADVSNIEIASYSFDRFTSLYDGLVKMAYRAGKILHLNVSAGIVHIFYKDRVDYSEEMEYCQDDTAFKIKKNFIGVNHLICLGQGELQNRLVTHLYVDADGDIVEKQYYYGIDERAQVYENNSMKSIEELKEEGVNKLGELKNGDSFEVIAPDDRDLHIGDIIGGYEKVTGYRIRREITNIIAKIDDIGVDISYTVGGDEPGAAGLPSDIIEEYILPIATQQTLGGIKIGSDFVIENGVIGCPSIRLCRETIEKTSKICA